MTRRRKRMTAKQRFYFGRKRHSSRRGSARNYGISGLLAAGAYGAARGFIANKLQPLTSKIPLGSYADNIGMIALLLGLKKFVKNPLISQFADKGLIVEGALIGSEIVTTGLPSTNNSNVIGWQ